MGLEIANLREFRHALKNESLNDNDLYLCGENLAAVIPPSGIRTNIQDAASVVLSFR